MWRWFWPSMALSAVVAVAIGLAVGGHLSPGARGVFARGDTPAPVPTLWAYIDKDITNGEGPCDPNHIDTETTEYLGDQHQLAVCVAGLSQPVYAFNLRIRYDDMLDECVERDCALGPCLDDNPDASAGQTRWGDGLGDGWTCLFPPPLEGPYCDQGLARITCVNSMESGSHTLGDNESWGALAVLTLGVADIGVDEVGIEYLDVFGSDNSLMGVCPPPTSGSPAMPCQGAADTKVEPGPTHTPPPTPSLPPSPPTATLAPPPVVTAPPPDGGAAGPIVAPPATGGGPPESRSSRALTASLLAGVIAAAVGGFCLRSAENRQRGGTR
jgi:hypothetical protein